MARARSGSMVALDGGTFRMGSNDFYPEERPAHVADVAPFHIDVGPVTNSAFSAFVAATGYVTEAERRPADLRVSFANAMAFARWAVRQPGDPG